MHDAYAVHPDSIDNDLIRELDTQVRIIRYLISEKEKKDDDPVNHPSHYTYGSIECIDYLDAIGIGEAFCRGNVIKYTTRLGHKVDDIEDAKKVVWYAQHIVDKLADGTYHR